MNVAIKEDQDQEESRDQADVMAQNSTPSSPQPAPLFPASENHTAVTGVGSTEENPPLFPASDNAAATGVGIAGENSTALSNLEIPGEFVDDLSYRLGRANGNVFHRKPGVNGAHDGQIMVRLKKKRFIVIDYGITPEDVNSVTTSKTTVAPTGAGRQICASPDCAKVGVPVLLYDSAPEEPRSLYLRSGLCFTCQRALNEKRRTQRKRKSDVVNSPENSSAQQQNNSNGGSRNQQKTSTLENGYNVKNNTPAQKRYKLNDQIINLPNDAIVINNPSEGTKRYENDHGLHQIGADVKIIANEISDKVDRLFHSVPMALPLANNNSTGIPADAGSSDASNSFAIAAAAAVAAAAAAAASDQIAMQTDELRSAANAVAAVASANSLNVTDDTKSGTNDDNQVKKNGHETAACPISVASREEVTSLFDETIVSMKKGIFLLSQWKTAWDAKMTKTDNDIASEVLNEAIAKGVTMNDSKNTDAAASSSIAQDTSSNMIPLLLAAEAKGSNGNQKKESTESSSDFFPVSTENSAAAMDTMGIGCTPNSGESEDGNGVGRIVEI